MNAAARQANYPNLQALARDLSAGDPNKGEDFSQYAKSCVQPGIAYYFQHMKQACEAFKTTCLFSPSKLHEMIGLEAVDALVAFPSLSVEIAALKEEFPLYTATAEDVDPSYDPLLFWKQHESTLPYWSQAARHILLLQPSSASPEKVFSLLRNLFGEHQHSSMHDYIEALLMLQYKKR